MKSVIATAEVQMKIDRLYSTLACLLLCATAVQAGVPEDATAARDAFRAKDITRLSAAADRLAGTPLEPYPQYWKLAVDLDRADPAAVDDFLTRYPHSALSDRLRADWLVELGQRADWANFKRLDTDLVNDTLEIRCYRLQTAMQEGGRPDDALRRLWVSGAIQPKSCWGAYATWQARGGLNDADLWLRLRWALRDGRISKSDNLAAVRDLSNFAATTSSTMRVDIRQLESVYKDARKYLGRLGGYPTARMDREVTLFALGRVAMDEPNDAAAILSGWQDAMPAEDRAHAWGVIAFWAAYKLRPEADSWFHASQGALLSDLQLTWKARAGLRQGDWPMVAEAVDAMSPELARDPAWRYWKARSLAVAGDLDGSVGLYRELAGEHSFYGLLAAEELGSTALRLGEAYQPNEEEIKRISQHPGLQRALLLYQMDWRADAVREWNWSLRNLDDRQLLAAAELARRNEWYDRTISTADRTKQLHNFSLRFLSPYRQVMKDQTAKIGLDESWVYGLIRQESRFVQVAKSVVGAAGLMQLMPGTASWIAKRIGLAGYKQNTLHDIDTNVLLGTSYLRYVLDSLGHPVLATAAYNAGPGRARAWLATQPMEGAIYAETIPFDETRDYVKKVMANSMYYAALLGDPYMSLKKRLGVMPARAAGNVEPTGAPGG